MDKLKKFSKELRANSTDAERLFWSKVRAHRFHGIKFKRQQPIGPYIVDFVCFDRKLVVELDGGQHAESESDPKRDAWLRSEGFVVLRFWNNEVLTNIEGVMTVVASTLFPPSPQPSPTKGEGVKKLPPP